MALRLTQPWQRVPRLGEAAALCGALCVAWLLPGGCALAAPAAAGIGSPAAVAEGRAAPAASPPRAAQADFGAESPSAEARQVADWVVASGDGQGLSFLVIDKKQARVFVFSATGRLRGAAPVLLGAAPGDHTVPGIGERKLSAILPHERTTPAGRFLAELDFDIHGEEVLWVDYDNAVSLHRLPRSPAHERRSQRLTSASVDDNRITFGCINVAPAFFETVVLPTFRGTRGYVYLLPEHRSLAETFGWPRARAP